MHQTLSTLFTLTIQFNEENYSAEQIQSNWLGNPPASKEAIEEAENRLGVKFPADYVQFLSIANGFPTCSDAFEPSFQKVEEIDYFRNYAFSGIDEWKESGESDDLPQDLERTIMIAGFEEEQHFLLIPPLPGDFQWKYWKFANWIPGEEPYADLEDYLKSVIGFLKEEMWGN